MCCVGITEFCLGSHRPPLTPLHSCHQSMKCEGRFHSDRETEARTGGSPLPLVPPASRVRKYESVCLDFFIIFIFWSSLLPHPSTVRIQTGISSWQSVLSRLAWSAKRYDTNLFPANCIISVHTILGNKVQVQLESLLHHTLSSQTPRIKTIFSSVFLIFNSIEFLKKFL